MQKFFSKALLVTCFVTSASYAETLNEIYQQALKNDHTFKAQKAAYAAGLENKKIGLSGLLPQVNGSYSWSDGEDETSGIDELRGNPSNNFLVDTDGESTSSGYSVELSQPLFDLAAWHSYKKGGYDSRIAQAQFNADSQSLIIRAAETYLNILRAVDNFETAKAEENANSHQLEQTKKRFEVGLTAITEVHEAQAAYDDALARRLLQEGNVGIAFEALEVITGQSYQYITPLKKDFPIVPPSPEKREKWVEFSIQNNFSLAVTSLNAESARQTARQLKAGHFPTVYASATYSDTNSESTSVGLESDLDTESQTVGITVRIPLFSGGGTSARRRQAASRYLETKENYFQAQRDTVQNARSLHLSVVTDVATVKARKQAITSNQSAVEATQAGYGLSRNALYSKHRATIQMRCTHISSTPFA